MKLIVVIIAGVICHTCRAARRFAAWWTRPEGASEMHARVRYE